MPFPHRPVPARSSEKAITVGRLALVPERLDMIIQPGRNSACTAALLPAVSLAVSLTVCGHNHVNINSHSRLGNIPEETGASIITSNRASTVSLAVEIPASSIIIAGLTIAESLEVAVVVEDELPRRRGGDEESGEKCELHGEGLAVSWLKGWKGCLVL